MMKYASFLLFYFCISYTFGQSINSYQTVKIDAGNSFIRNDIKDGVKDSKGFLWIATSNGIIRYAGKESVVFNTINTPIITNPVFDRLIIVGSTLYATAAGEIFSIDIHTLKISSLGFNNEFGAISDLGHYRDSLLIAITKNGILIRYEIKHSKLDTIQLSDAELMKICIDPKGNAFVSVNTPSKILKYNITANRVVNSYITPNLSFFTNEEYLTGIGIVFFTTKNTIRYNELRDCFEPFFTSLGPLTNMIVQSGQFIYVSPDNSVYSTSTRGSLVGKSIIINSEPVIKIFNDQNGIICILTRQSVLLSRSVDKFIKIQESTRFDTSLKIRRSIVEDYSRHRIFYFSYQGVEVYNTLLKKYERVIGNIQNACATSKDDRYIWITTEGNGLYRLQLSNLNLEQVYSKRYGKRSGDNNFISILKDKPRHILIGTYSSLLLYDDEKSTMREIDLLFMGKAYRDVSVHHILRRNANEIWIATNKGVFVLSNYYKILHLYSIEQNGVFRLPSNNVNVLHFADNGCFFGLDNDIIFSSFVTNTSSSIFNSNPTTCAKVVSICSDSMKRIWFSTYAGLYCYTPKYNYTRPFHAPAYYTNDEFNRTSSMMSDDGNLYYGTTKEFIKLNPLHYSIGHDNSSLVLNALLLQDGNSVDTTYNINDGDIVSFPLPNTSFRLSFILQDLINEKSAKYFYKIDGLTKNWISLDDRPYIELLSLPGGSWILQLKAITPDNLMTKIVSLSLEVPTVFYKTLWFYVLLILSLSIIFYVLYQFRMSGYKNYLAFRIELANELHDTVGTAVTKSIYAAEGLLHDYGIKDKRLQMIVDNGRHINAAFRDALWSVDVRTDNMESLFDRIIEIGYLTTEGSRFAFEFSKQKGLSPIHLGPMQKRNILMILREAMNNILKYSNGSIIKVDLKTEGKKVHFSITDNGFNSIEKTYDEGMGFKSMRHRAMRMNASLDISHDHNGFYVKLIL